jgi:hypothetical protein
LKWRYRVMGSDKKANEKAWEVIEDFSECLDRRGGARLELPKQ